MNKYVPILVGLAMLVASADSEAQLKVLTKAGEPQFASSVSCAKCHQDIHRYWKESLHAHAIEDYIFQAAFMTALKERGDEVRRLCLGCHSPTVLTTGDVMLKERISQEAITCDFCHRVSEVGMEDGRGRVVLTSGEEKYGPLEPGEQMDSHPSVKSGSFADSRFCAVCHQWSNAQGVAIFDTYREWLRGPFPAKQMHCQNCHMPLVEGSLVEGRGEGKDLINSHNLSGGHSIVQVASAAEVRIVSVSRVVGGMRAVVEVANVGSGHMIPTGIPSRELVLEAQLLDSNGRVVETGKHVFRRVILDGEHHVLTSDADIILRGAAISKDNRIPPGGKVEVPFFFAASERKDYLVRVTLRYSYRPLVMKEEQISIEMGSDSKSP